MTQHKGANLPEARVDDVVVGVDGSSSSKTALRWALSQARLTGGRVLAVTAWEMPVPYGWEPPHPYGDVALAAGRMLSEAVREALGLDVPDVEVLESVVVGHPAQVLIDISEHAAVLVIGSHGHGRFAGALLGSISQQCVQHSRCPVVVVRGTSEA
jgi:nucleotide-binding universal stress UspA family protein